MASTLLRTVVTVTYGKRWALLRQALASARREGFARAVVVDNGSHQDIKALAAPEFGDFVDLVRMGRNVGSAGGFKAGLQRACSQGDGLLMLLDDDNVLEPGCGRALEAAWRQHAQNADTKNLAMLAFREDRLREVATHTPANGSEGHVSAFFGFEWKDLPFKIYRRTPWGRRWLATLPLRDEATLAFAPYSGMFFHTDVIAAHGLPDERFVLYADDTDFSYRITRAGGKLVLVSAAKLTDLEPSWSTTDRFGNQFDALLCGEGDFRAFYSTRNNAYYERWAREQGGSLGRRVNRLIFLFILKLRARTLGRGERLAVLMRAIREGEEKRLGISEAYPLQ